MGNSRGTSMELTEDVVTCFACLFGVSLVVGSLMWIIWGAIIMDDANGLKHENTCRGTEYWWHCCTAYIYLAADFAMIWITRRELPTSGGGLSQLLPSGLCEMIVSLVRWCFVIYYTIYAIILWSALRDADAVPSFDIDMSLLGDIDCNSWFNNHSNSYQKFLVLWKVTAVLSFLSSVLICAILGLGILSASTASSYSSADNSAQEHFASDPNALGGYGSGNTVK